MGVHQVFRTAIASAASTATLCALFALLGSTAPMPVQAQAPARRPHLSGPAATFTAGQAALGKAAYALNCASCHGRNLSGSEFAAALNGNRFSQRWSGKTAAALFTYIRTRMPPGKPGSLAPPIAARLVAYLIEVNGGAPGDAPLPDDATRLAALIVPWGPTAPAPPMMPLSPLAPPMSPVVLPNPLDKITTVDDALLRDPPDGEWLLWRRTYDDQGFSPLREITRQNVGDLRIAWAWSLPNGPNEATPLEHDGVLFVFGYGDNVQALNAVTGDLLWQYARRLPSDAQLAIKRNLALYRDKLLVPTSDCHVVALDVRTGAVTWDSPVADYQRGWRLTGGPLVAQGKVMQGITGLSPGGAGIVGLDFETGRVLWHFHSIARPGEPGGNSWNGLPLEKRSGASVWTAGSYDPQLRLAYFGVGQTYDTGPLLHPIHAPGVTNDGLYTDSTLAIDPATGKLVWYFQHVHNDQWDLDWAFEQQRIDLAVDGVPRKLVVTSGKMGIYEGMDAANGHYVFSKDLGIQNVVASIDPRTGEKTINPAVVVGDGKPHTICPHPGGGRNWIAASYNRSTGMLYVPLNETCMDLIPAPPGERGNLSSGYDWFIRARSDSDGKFGRVEALSLHTKRPVWIDRQRAPQTTCMLDTAGGVVFAGAMDRYLKAYDDATGKVLWRVRLNDIPNSCPISYSVQGKQYLAVVVGGGGSIPSTYPVLVPEIQNPPEHGAEVWVFALPGS
ncbi:MAG TPA: PQQ-binding-like beta-propeller repeat protein [Steroidobacteraceae bacterium]|nr:PQQ-binding-like beta-propeller repeat protein [Steroidobacteraceae bacterium]